MAHPHRGLAGPARARVQRAGRRLAGALPRRPRRARAPTSPTSTAEQQARRLDAADDEFRELVFDHACEALYGDPVYGGNRDGAGWVAIGFAGDVQPRGWTDAEVERP